MQNNGNRFYLYIIYDGHYFCTSFRFDKIKIFLQEYKKTLLDRASFFIPYDIENRIRKGNSILYQEQYLCNTSLVCNDDRLTSLLGLFAKYAKVYEQEGYIIK
jgi:hypothetical protein